MPKTDNSHSIRLYDSIVKYADETTAERIVHKIPLSKAADINKKFAWAESICADLENELDDAVVKAIRMDCACGPAIKKIDSLRKIYLSSTDIDDFVEKVNKASKGYTMEHRDNILYLIYPECYCSCVKRIDKPISKAWCYCTLGYTKKMFEHILGKTVEVELVESVKTGGSRCVIQVNYA